MKFVPLHLICALFLGLTISFTAHSADDIDTQLKRIIDRSGLEKLIKHVPQLAHGVLKQSSGAIEPQMSSALSGAFNQAFQPDLVQRDFTAILRSHYDAKQASDYLQLEETPLARKVTQLERALNDPEQQKNLRQFAEQLQKKPAAGKRLALINRLDKANRTSELRVDMETAFFKAVFAALDPVMEADMRLGEGELQKMENEVRQSLQAPIERGTQTYYLYAYRELNDTELKTYVELCESSAHRWAIQILGNAMVSALNQAGERAAKIMAQK